ncbi:MAG: TauD/TfdA family dioxygenase [Pseudomonadota bacterium]
MPSFDLEPMVGAFGARVTGIDLSQPLDATALTALRAAWLEHLVLVFPDQILTPEQQIAAADQFGRPCENPFVAGLPDYPVVIPIVKEAHDRLSFGEGWHSDQTYEAVPPKGSLLYMKEAPPVGGDTLWLSMYAAYEALSPAMQALLEGVVANHYAGDAFGPKATFATRDADQHSMTIKVSEAADEAVRHPLVCRHPDTGRKLLFVNPVFTRDLEGFSAEESKALLSFLYSHQQDPRFATRHRWTVGDVVLWDNRCTQHSANNDYHGHRREAHRVTIAQEAAEWQRVWDGRPIAA